MARKSKEQIKRSNELFNVGMELGIKAFNSGKMAVPAMDSDCIVAVSGLDFDGRISVYNGWSRGWHTTNVNQVVDLEA